MIYLDVEKTDSWKMGQFIRPENGNPVINPDPNATFFCPILKTNLRWEALHVFNPAAIVKDDKVFLFYRAEDDSGQMKIGGYTSRLGIAESSDGIHFEASSTPVLFPALDDQKKIEWPGGCEDPRMIEADTGEYIIYYTAKGKLLSRLVAATSTDLIHWKKHGLVFPKLFPFWANWYTKSGSVLCSVQDGKLKAIKMNGKYWMYWGVLFVCRLQLLMIYYIGKRAKFSFIPVLGFLIVN